MNTNRRRFLRWSAAAGAGVGSAALTARAARGQGATDRPGGGGGNGRGRAGSGVDPRAPPDDWRHRADYQRGAARAARESAPVDGRESIGAIVLEGGSSLFYFMGVRWGLSERPFVAVIPAKGEPAWVCPTFEEARARELIEIGGKDVRTWQEDDSPYRLVAQILKDRGVATGRVGFEERVRFFVFNGVRKEAPALDYVSADPVTAGCRMIKSAAEIALMQRANDMTIAAYKAGLATLKEGMTQGDLRNNILAAYRALGAQGRPSPPASASTPRFRTAASRRKS